MEDFGICSKEQGFLVVFKCRDKLKALNNCLAEHNSDEMFDLFKKGKEEELQKKMET